MSAEKPQMPHKARKSWYRSVFFPETREGRTICCMHITVFTLLLVTVLMPIMLYAIADSGINTLVVEDSSDAPSYDSWRTNIDGDGADIDIHYDLYLFDIQNPETSLQGEKMAVVEKGPYSFDKYYRKFDISWSQHGEHVTYTTQNIFFFNEARSGAGLTLEDSLTMVYPTVASFDFALRGFPVPADFADVLSYELIQKYDMIGASINAYRNETGCPGSGGVNCTVADQALLQVNELKVLSTTYIQGLDSFADAMRLVYCQFGPNGMSPYWQVDPVKAYFGFLNDPILTALEALTGIPMSTAVPGLTTNYTSQADATRRRTPDIMHTGKNDARKVGRYVRAYNMSGEQWVCFESNISTTNTGYIPGENFPACKVRKQNKNEPLYLNFSDRSLNPSTPPAENSYIDRSACSDSHTLPCPLPSFTPLTSVHPCIHVPCMRVQLFQAEWTDNDEEAEFWGYGQAWSDKYANRIAGSDGTSYGRPVTDTKVTQRAYACACACACACAL